MRVSAIVCVALMIVIIGCGSEATTVPSVEGGAGGAGGSGGAAVEGCPAGTIPEGDACLEPGVPIDGCAEGFAHDGGHGCEPIVPPTDCGDGAMVILGTMECQPIASCPRSAYAPLPEGEVAYVDALAAAGGDGSLAAPFSAIQAAIDASASGGVVAIAAGSYSETVTIDGKALHLVGRCPETPAQEGVVIVGDETGPAVSFGAGAGGGSIRGVTITGSSHGLAVADEVRAEEIWIDHVTQAGILVTEGGELTLRRARIDLAHDGGASQALVVQGATLDATELDVVVAIAPTTGDGYQPAVALSEATVELTKSRLVVRGTIDADTTAAFYARHGTTELDGVYIHVDVTPQLNLSDLLDLPGLACLRVDRSAPGGGEVALRLRGSILRGGFPSTLVIVRAKVEIDHSVIRELPAVMIARGVECSPSATNGAPPPAEVLIRRSLLDDLAWTGIDAGGCEVTLDGSVVRGTKSALIPGGISAIFPEIDESYGGMKAAVAALARPANGLAGLITVRDSLFVDNHAVAVAAYSAAVVIDHSRIAATHSTTSGDGRVALGDGLVLAVTSAFNDDLPVAPTAIVRDSQIEASGRAGIASFGGRVEVEGSRIACSPIALHGQTMTVDEVSFPPSYQDHGQNACGCEGLEACHVVSDGLTPPPPLLDF